MTWVNLDLPEEIHEKAKVDAIKAKTTLKEYLINIIKEGVRGNGV